MAKLPKVTQYVKNVGKSTFYASIDAIKTNTPGINDFLEVNNDIFKTAYSKLKNIRKTTRDVEKTLKQSRLYNSVETGIRNMIEDAKTGNFYNDRSDEFASKMMEEDEYNYDFLDDSFDEEKSSRSSTNNTKILSDSFSDAIGAAAVSQNTVVAKSTDFMVKTSKTNTKMILGQMDRISARFSSGMGAVYTNIDKVNQFLNGPLFTHLENSKKFYEETTRLLRDQQMILKELLETNNRLYKKESFKRKETNFDRSLSYGGIPDIKGYAKNVKDNISDWMYSQGLGMLGGGLGGMALDNIAASPFKFIMEPLMQRVLSKDLKKSLRSFNKGFSTLFSQVIARLNKARDTDGGMLGVLGRIFGIRLDTKKSINTSNYEKGPVPFDGITRQTIIEVIPGYLSRIESAITGRGERHYDSKTGTWKSAKQIQKEFEREKSDIIASANYGIKVDTSSLVSEIKQSNEKAAASITKSIDRMILRIFEDGGDFKLDKKRWRYYGFNSQKEFEIVLQQLSKSTIRDIAYNNMKANQDYANRLRESELNGGIYRQLHNGAYDNEGIGNGKKANPSDFIAKNNLLTMAKDTYNHDVFYYLREILGVISSKRNKSTGGNTSGRIPATTKRSNSNTGNSKEGETKSEDSDDSDTESFDFNNSFSFDWKSTTEKKRREEEQAAKDRKLGDIISEWFGDSRVGKSLGKMFGKAGDLLAKPMQYMTKMLNKADENMFKLIFGEEEFKNSEGKRGVFGVIVETIKKTFEDVGNFVKEQFNSIKSRFKEVMKPYWDKYGKPVKDEMVNMAKGAKDRVKRGLSNVFGRFSQRLNNGDVISADEAESGIGESARGGIVTKRGLTMISPGEMIIPASFNKKEQNKMLALEKRDKRRIMNAIQFNAAGTVDTDEIKKRLRNIYDDNMGKAPKNIASGILGAGVGLFSGISPLLGAAAGAGLSILSNSESFKKLLFGGINKNGEETKGIIPKKIVDVFKKAAPDMGDFGIAGGLLGLFTPFGILGGAAIGAGIGYLKNSKGFEKFVFGDQATGEEGLMKRETFEKFKSMVNKAVPNMAIGAVGGALLGPFGLLGNSVMGAGLGLLSTTQSFHNFIFGKDGDDPKKKGQGGLVGAIRRGIIDPAKERIVKIIADLKGYAKKNIIDPMKNFFKPFTEGIKNIVKSIGQSVSDHLQNMFERTIGIPIHDFLQQKIFKPITKVMFGILKAPLAVGKAVIAAPFRALGGIGNSIRMGQIKRGTANYMTAAERLKFRQDHKGRKFMGEVTGTDTTREQDEMLSNMSIEQLEELARQSRESVKFGSDFRKKTGEARRAVGEEISSFFNTYDDAGVLMYDKMGYKNVRKLAKLAATGDMGAVRAFLDKQGGISDASKERLISKISSKMDEAYNANAGSKAGHNAENALDAEISNILGKKFKGLKSRRRIAEAAEAELKLRGNSEESKSPEEAATNNLTNIYTEKADTIISYISSINDQLRIIIDPSYKPGNKSTTTSTENKSPVSNAIKSLTPGIKPVNEDSKEATEYREEEEEQENVEKRETEATEKTNSILQTIHDKLVGTKDKVKEKGMGILSSIGSGFSKLLKFLGVGGKVALAIGGASLLGHASQWFKTSIWPTMREGMIGENGLLTKAKNWFQDKAIPYIINGLAYSAENVVGPAIALLIKNIPKIAVGLVKGLIKGLGSIITKKKAEGQEEKLALGAMSSNDNLVKEFSNLNQTKNSAIESSLSPELRKSLSGVKNGNSSVYAASASTSGASSSTNSAGTGGSGKVTALDEYGNKIELNPSDYGLGEVEDVNDTLTKKSPGLMGLLGQRKNTNIVRYDENGNVLTMYDTRNTHDSSLSSLAKTAGLSFRKGLLTGKGNSKIIDAAANMKWAKPKAGIIGNIASGTKNTVKAGAKTVGFAGDLGSGLRNKILGNKNIAKTAAKETAEQATKTGAKKGIVSTIKSKWNTGIAKKMSNSSSKIFKSSAENVAEKGIIKGMASTAKSKAIDGVKTVAKKAAKSVSDSTIGKGIGELFEKIAKSTVVDKICGFAQKILKKAIDPSIVQNAIKKIGNAIAEKILKGSAKVAMKETTEQIANACTFGLGSIAFFVIDFLYGYNNAYTMLGITKGTEYEVNIGHKCACGLLNAVVNLIPFVGGFIPTDVLMQLIMKYILPIFGYDPSSLQAAQEESSKILDEWNKAHPDEQYDNIEDFNNKDKWTTKVKKGIKKAFTKSNKEAKDAIRKSSKLLTTNTVSSISTSSSSYKNIDAFSLPTYSSKKSSSVITHGGKSGAFGKVSQLDPSISGMNYNGHTIAQAGCAPVAATNLINSVKGGNGISVAQAANYAIKKGFKPRNDGTDPRYMSSILSASGVPNERVSGSAQIKSSLKQGSPVVIMGKGKTSASPYGNKTPHYITAMGYDNKGNIIVDDPYERGYHKYKESDVMNGAMNSIATKRSRKGFGRYGFGMDEALKQKIISKTFEITNNGEGDYDTVIPNDNGSWSVGIAGFHNDAKIRPLFEDMASLLSGEAKEKALKYSKWGAKILTPSEEAEVKAFLQENKAVSKQVQDKRLASIVESNIRTPLDMYNSGVLKDYRSIILAGDIGNTGPAHLDDWRKLYKPTSGDELSHVRDSLKSSDSWWGRQQTGKNSRYYDGWMKRIDRTYNALANWSADNYTPNIGGSGSGSVSQSSNGSTSTSNGLFSKIKNLGSSMMKKIYGEKAFNALFGSQQESPNGGDSPSVAGDGTVESFVQTALNEEGYKETGTNINKYGEYFNFNGQPWCAQFVSWAADQAGIPETALKRSASVQTFMDFFNKNGRLHSSSDASYTPKRGDIALFGTRHTGIVTGIDNDQIKTIEGNTSDSVAQRSYPLSGSKITYFGDLGLGAGTGSTGMEGTTQTTKAYGKGGYGDVNITNGGSAATALNSNSVYANRGPSTAVKPSVGSSSSYLPTVGAVDYVTFLKTIVTILMNISNNTAILTKILDILSSNFNINIDKSDIKAASLKSRAQAEKDLNDLIRRSSGNIVNTSSLINNKDTEYIIAAMKAIATE